MKILAMISIKERKRITIRIVAMIMKNISLDKKCQDKITYCFNCKARWLLKKRISKGIDIAAVVGKERKRNRRITLRILRKRELRKEANTSKKIKRGGENPEILQKEGNIQINNCLEDQPLRRANLEKGSMKE